MKNIQEASIEEIENKTVDVFLTREGLRELLEKIGYEIDETGVVIDREVKKPVRGLNGEEININREEGIALITSSHVFVKNVAELSHFLAERGRIKFRKIR